MGTLPYSLSTEEYTLTRFPVLRMSSVQVTSPFLLRIAESPGVLRRF